MTHTYFFRWICNSLNKWSHLQQSPTNSSFHCGWCKNLANLQRLRPLLLHWWKPSCPRPLWTPSQQRGLFPFPTRSVYWRRRHRVTLGLIVVLMPSRGAFAASRDRQLASGPTLDCLGWESSAAGPTRSLHWRAFIPKHRKSVWEKKKMDAPCLHAQ